MNNASLVEWCRPCLSWRPIDEFDSPPQLPSLAGRPFEITRRPGKRQAENRLLDGDCSWGYFVNDKSLEIDWILSYTLAYDLKYFGRLTFPSDVTNVRRNPFLKFRTFEGGHFLEDGQEGEALFAIADIGAPGKDAIAGFSLNVEGDEAHLLAENTLIRATGMLMDWYDGQPLVCGEYTSQYRWQPKATRRLICAFRGRFERFELVDMGSGNVLKRLELR